MVTKLAVLVSDLHMGRGNRQDDYAGDGRFERFCREIRDLADRHDAELQLILNGDILELWEVVPDDQLGPDPEVAQVIRENLAFPARTPAEKRKATKHTRWQIEQTLAAHPGFARGIARVLQAPGARVVYLYGNHDHSMAIRAVHSSFRAALNEITGTDLADEASFTFGYHFHEPLMGLYAEHGEQFAGNDSRSPLSPWGQAAGYYFLRFVWNRLQAQGQGPVRHDTAYLIVWTLNKIIFDRDDPGFANGLRYLFDYFSYIADLEAAGASEPEMVDLGILHWAYDWWKSNGRPTGIDDAAIRSARAAMAAEGRRAEPEAIMATRGAPSGFPDSVEIEGLPGRREPLDFRRRVDRFWFGIMERYEREQAPHFPRLNRDEHITVSLGHTHDELYMLLRSGPEARVRYINTGSWTLGSRPAYGWATNAGNPLQSRGLRVLTE